MMTLDSAHPAAGRRSRLSPGRRREIYQVVLDLLPRHGYEALTMDLIAARAHTSKATLYRKWSGKAELVVSALRNAKPPEPTDGIDTGSVVGDLRELMRRAGHRTADEMVLMRALLNAMQDSPELRRAFREVVVQPEIAGLRTLLARAAARGELAPDAPGPEHVAYMFLGALVGRPLLEEREADAEYLVRYVDAVILPALRPASPSRPSPR